MRVPFQLNYRERIAVCSALLVFGVLIVMEWGVFPVIRHRKSLDQAIRAKTLELEEIQKLQKTHVMLKQSAEGIRSRLALRDKGFTLFSYLDHSAGNTGVKAHIAYMKPSGTDIKSSDFKVFQVEMKLQSISLHQLSAFLFGVETADSLVRIKKASITRSGFGRAGLAEKSSDRPYIDAILWVESIAP